MLTLNLNILWTVVNILVLFVLLRKFLYRPVMNVIEQRQKQIDDAIGDVIEEYAQVYEVGSEHITMMTMEDAIAAGAVFGE